MNKDSDEDSGSGSQRKDDENSTKPEEVKESTVKDNNGESESAGTKSTIHEDKKNSPKDGSLPQGMNVILLPEKCSYRCFFTLDKKYPRF